MSTHSQKRDERIDLRVNSEIKSLFARAAELSGQKLSSFVIEAVRERAVRVIHEYEQLVLDSEARDVFLSALANSPSPSNALRRAAEKYAIR